MNPNLDVTYDPAVVAEGTEASPRRPLPLMRRLTRGGKMESRRRRYLLAAGLGIATVWGMAGAYLKLTPPSYTSAFTLILPGTGAGSSLNLERLGQASTTSAGAFASPELSPTENYRKMIISERVRQTAAELAGESLEGFPVPKVELSDQTKLISIKIVGRAPERAATRAEALRAAFLQVLDALRTDEIAARDTAYRTMLVGYKTRLNETRQRLIDHEASTGLISLDQYGTIVASVERLRDQVRDVEAKLAHMRAGVAELTRLLGTTVELATVAMTLRADPLFQALVEQSAKIDAELATLTGTRGQNNPRVVDLQAEGASTTARLASRALELTGLKRADVLKLRDIAVREERARLFERLIGQIADTQAMAAMHSQLTAQITVEQARVLSLAPHASRLDDLKRDVQVAEAVFSTALARIDTSKADFFASYPMVQTLEAPAMPTRPSGPLPILAVAGGMAATVLIFIALGLAWLRLKLLRKILKSV